MFLTLSDELILQIFTQLPGEDLISVQQVCKGWYMLATDYSLFDNYCKYIQTFDQHVSEMHPLHIVANYSRICSNRMLEQMIDKYDVDSTKKRQGSTALMYAVRYSDTFSSRETIQLLLDKGANINVQTRKEYTALIYACKYISTTSSFETVKMLVEAGADVNKFTRKNCTALSFIIDNHNVTKWREIVDYLVEHGANINQTYVKDDEGTNVFYSLICRELIEMQLSETVKMFLEKGAKLGPWSCDNKMEEIIRKKLDSFND